MAKGNLFLGTAARSVGDVVMYRREGSQVSRVRVRKIANPKTDAQCEQRAFMSAVVKFYQPLANVLDRSWQGLSRAKSYAKFLKTNVGIVRSGGYYIPKDFGFAPLPLQLSNGTIANSFSIEVEDVVRIPLTKPEAMESTPTTYGQLSECFIAMGYKAGDVVSIVCVTKDNDDNFIPSSVQFAIDSTSATLLSTPVNGGFLQCIDDEGTLYLTIHLAYERAQAGSVIVSRNIDGVWHRTKSMMIVNDAALNAFTTQAAKATAITSYKGSAAGDNPLVYLDGDELDNA